MKDVKLNKDYEPVCKALHRHNKIYFFFFFDTFFFLSFGLCKKKKVSQRRKTEPCLRRVSGLPPRTPLLASY